MKITEIDILQNMLRQISSSDKKNLESLFSFLDTKEKEHIEEGKEIVLGKYGLRHLLGKGGMSIVFLAWDREKCHEIALKILKCKDVEPGYDELLRLVREIKALSSLKHNSIVEFYESNDIHYKGIRLPCFSMEYIKNGKPLYCFLEYPNCIEWSIEIIKKVAWALAYAHKKNILHRDIKPGNIILDHLGNPKVLDFGLAKILGETESFRPTKEKCLLGSPQYISPEQYKNPLKVDKKTDIYSLGTVFYHLLTGRLPSASLEKWSYHGEEDKKNLEQIFQNFTLNLNFFQDIHLDKHIEKICQKALAIDPAERYSSIEELIQDLESYSGLRSNAQEHFLFFHDRSPYPLKKRRVFLTYHSHLSLEEIANSENTYAELILFQGTECYIIIRKRFMLNGKYVSSGNQRLYDGDWLNIHGNIVSYKKLVRY
ncbi:MAG: serine/threonine protein kinase [Candidatus Brocadiae bacterium]|nr:serine/threonine protein kinase [Candidatus Brocadiia bacterium]